MGRKGHQRIAILLLLWLTSCVKDEPYTFVVPQSNTGNIYIVCEGNFGNGDGTLYQYDAAKDSIYGDLYKAANGQAMGDVFQSMQRIGDRLFLCINNSDKVVAINAADKKITGTISVPKPRYILPISDSRAYVSSLYSNKVCIIDPQAYTVTGSIELPYTNTEGMCLYNGTAFICTWDTACSDIYKVNTTTGELIQTIKVAGRAPQEALLDKEQKLWVLSGNKTKGKTAALTRIDPFTGDILTAYHFPASADPLKPVFNAAKDTLYFIEVDYTGKSNNNGIFRMGIHDLALPEQAFISTGQYQYFWGLGIDPATGYIYVGDPKGFVQKGSVTIYRPDGSAVTSFITGLGPGHIYFDK